MLLQHQGCCCRTSDVAATPVMLLQQQELAQNHAKIKRVTKWVAVGPFGLKIGPDAAQWVINPIIPDFGPNSKIIFYYLALCGP